MKTTYICNKNTMPICDFCKKKKLIVVYCSCNASFCLKHNLPNKHNCLHDGPNTRDLLSKEPTGAFKKIEKI